VGSEMCIRDSINIYEELLLQRREREKEREYEKVRK
jgi:hypothetical protein